MLPRILTAILSLLLIPACTDPQWGIRQDGEFTGRVFLMWTGPGSGTNGDGKFVYIPDPDNGLTFTRNVAYPDYNTISPGVMYTDGGSVPRVAQVFKGLQPWGYAPAYMVHDWLFVAQDCIRSGDANSNEAKMAGMPFDESVYISTETLQALIRQGQIAEGDVKSPAVIASAVGGPWTRARWASGDCRRLTEKDQEAVDKFLNRRSYRSMRLGDTMPGSSGLKLVSVIEF